MIQYERTYRRLKNQIECGSLLVGTRLPGRSVLCREFGASERTIRRALDLLEQDGFLELRPRRRPTVIFAFAAPEGRAQQNTRRVDAAQVSDLMQTANLLCRPIYLRGGAAPVHRRGLAHAGDDFQPHGPGAAERILAALQPALAVFHRQE